MHEGSERRKRTVEGFLFAFVLFTIAIVGIGLGVRRWLPPLASEHGAGIDRMIRYLLITVGRFSSSGTWPWGISSGGSADRSGSPIGWRARGPRSCGRSFRGSSWHWWPRVECF